jgi:hypothetical protein
MKANYPQKKSLKPDYYPRLKKHSVTLLNKSAKTSLTCSLFPKNHYEAENKVIHNQKQINLNSTSKENQN